MGAAKKFTNKKVLQTFVPFNALSPTHFNEVARKTHIETVRAGSYLFHEGDRDNKSVYLLDGDVNLLSGKDIVGTVYSDSASAQHPLAQRQPRQVSARARSTCVVARVDTGILDVFLAWDQSTGYEVQEINEEEGGDWMTRMLQSDAFLKVPPANIQRLLMSAESISAEAGDVIIRQGGEGKYFYIIKSGRCVVTRQASSSGNNIKLAELSDGDVFGEEALVSEEKRNATVTMVTDGTLMRLAKEDFLELLKEPLIQKVTYKEAVRLDPLETEWLDVRLPGEFENSAIPGSRNIPLSALRHEAGGLDRDTKYVVCCDTGRRSASAAFILSQRGFDVYLLLDGLSQVPASELTGVLEVLPGQAAPITKAEVYELELEQGEQGKEAVPESATDEFSEQSKAVREAEFAQVLQQLEEACSRSEMLEENLEAVQLELKAVNDRHQKETRQMRATMREQTLELEENVQEARAQEKEKEDAAAELCEKLKQLELVTKGREDELRQSQEQVQQLEEELAQTLASAANDAGGARQAQQDAMEKLQGELSVLRTQHEQLQIEHEHQVAELNSRLQKRDEELTGTVRTLEEALEVQRQQDPESDSAREQHVADLATQIEQQSQSLDEFQNKIEELQAERSELNTALESVRAQLEEQNAQHAIQVSVIQHQLTATEEQLLEASNETVVLRNQIVELEQVRQGVEENNDKVAAERDRQSEALKELQEALASSKVRYNELESRMQAQVSALNAQLEEARQEFVTANGSLSSENAALREELESKDRVAAADGDQERQRLEAELSALADQLQDAAGKQIELDAQLAELTTTAEADRQAIAGFEVREAQLDEQVVAIKGELEQARADRGEALDQARRETEKIRVELETVLRERNALENSLQQTEQRMVEMEAAAKSVPQDSVDRHARETELKEQVSTLKNRISTLQADKSAAEDAITGLEKDLDVSRAALSREQQRLEGYKKRLAESLDTVGQASAAEIEQLHVVLDEAEARADAAERAAVRLQDAFEDMKSKKAEEHAALTAELEQLRKVTSGDIEVTHAELQRLRQELEIARQANTRETSEGEIERLRFLLEEARDQIARYQAGSDDESTLLNSLPEAISDNGSDLSEAGAGQEAMHMRDELAAANKRVDEMSRQHEDARVEAENLRHELEIANTKLKLAEAPGAAQAMRERDIAYLDIEPPVRQQRTRAARGLIFGLVVGTAGAAGFFWFDAWQNFEVPGVADGASPFPAVTETSTAPVSPEPSALDALPAVKGPAATGPVEAPAPVEEIPVVNAEEVVTESQPSIAVREFRDALADYGPGPTMIELSGGEFFMGSGTSSLDSDERPRHKVTVPAFSVGKYEVTFEEYDTFADDSGRPRPDDEGWGRGSRPVINVSWHDAVAYAEWLSKQTGKTYRLLTEAEWEFMAGAGSRRLYWWGTNIGARRANCFNCGSQWDADRTAPTGSFLPNSFGIHDTAGNVQEWVKDCYHGSYEFAREDGSAWLESGCALKVNRGGGFNSAANTLRTTKRTHQAPGSRLETLGFRLARDL